MQKAEETNRYPAGSGRLMLSVSRVEGETDPFNPVTLSSRRELTLRNDVKASQQTVWVA